MRNFILGLIVCLIAVGIFTWVVIKSEEGSEIVECHTLVSQSENKYDAKFFITGWQDEMCRAHGIIINAEVK